MSNANEQRSDRAPEQDPETTEPKTTEPKTKSGLMFGLGLILLLILLVYLNMG